MVIWLVMNNKNYLLVTIMFYTLGIKDLIIGADSIIVLIWCTSQQSDNNV